MRYYLREIEFSRERTWELVRWCLQHGSEDFSWREMGLVGHSDPVIEDANTLLRSFATAADARSPSTIYSGHPDKQVSKLWRLEEQSIELLKRQFPDGLFTEPTYRQDGWLEDPTFYRRGEIMLGVVSHEGEAYLEISDVEAAELTKENFILHSRGMYI